MAFSIITEAVDNPDPYEMGELQLLDPDTGRTSTPVPKGRRYMVFIEVATIFGFLVMAMTNSRRDSYTVSDGSRVSYDPKSNMVTFDFRELTLKRGARAALDDLRSTIYEALQMLSHAEDQNDVVLRNLRETAVDGDYL